MKQRLTANRIVSCSLLALIGIMTIAALGFNMITIDLTPNYGYTLQPNHVFESGINYLLFDSDLIFVGSTEFFVLLLAASAWGMVFLGAITVIMAILCLFAFPSDKPGKIIGGIASGLCLANVLSYAMTGVLLVLELGMQFAGYYVKSTSTLTTQAYIPLILIAILFIARFVCLGVIKKRPAPTPVATPVA